MKKPLVWIPAVILSVFVGSAFGQTSRGGPVEIATVCDVLERRESFNGKTLIVIGRWSSTDEGFWLTDDCRAKIKTGGYTWKNLIWLDYDPSAPTGLSNGFKPHKKSVLAKVSQMKARMEGNPGKIEWGVVYGQMVAGELTTVVSLDGRSTFPNGFGHLNGAPAQVVYRQKDLWVLSH